MSHQFRVKSAQYAHKRGSLRWSKVSDFIAWNSRRASLMVMCFRTIWRTTFGQCTKKAALLWEHGGNPGLISGNAKIQAWSLISEFYWKNVQWCVIHVQLFICLECTMSWSVKIFWQTSQIVSRFILSHEARYSGCVCEKGPSRIVCDRTPLSVNNSQLSLLSRPWRQSKNQAQSQLPNCSSYYQRQFFDTRNKSERSIQNVLHKFCHEEGVDRFVHH